MNWTDPEVVAAIVAAVVSIAIFVIGGVLKPFWQIFFHGFKLKAEHKYDQRKKVKEAISRQKVYLLNAAESLNHRLWNFSINCKTGWHQTNGYYINSFVYRFLSFFAWARKIDKEMVFLDSTISDKEDLLFIKYLKLFPQIFCDVEIFGGQNYDPNKPGDHFFKDDFIRLMDLMIKDDQVISFNDFHEGKGGVKKYAAVYKYLSGVSLDQSCLKWYAIHLFHFILMAFLSEFGYDFQKTSKNKLRTIAQKVPKNILIENMTKILERFHLEKSKQIEISLAVLRRV